MEGKFCQEREVSHGCDSGSVRNEIETWVDLELGCSKKWPWMLILRWCFALFFSHNIILRWNRIIIGIFGPSYVRIDSHGSTFVPWKDECAGWLTIFTYRFPLEVHKLAFRAWAPASRICYMGLWCNSFWLRAVFLPEKEKWQKYSNKATGLFSFFFG